MSGAVRGVGQERENKGRVEIYWVPGPGHQQRSEDFFSKKIGGRRDFFSRKIEGEDFFTTKFLENQNFSFQKNPGRKINFVESIDLGVFIGAQYMR